MRLGGNFAFSTQQASVRLRWLLDTEPTVRAAVEAGDALFGTVDTWLVWRLTGGAVHATDYSNASSTGLYDCFEVRAAACSAHRDSARA